MFDGFWSGIFGGLFGPAVALWLSRFKYWAVFLVATLSVHVYIFVLGWLDTNFLSSFKRGVTFACTSTGFFAPMIIGVLAVFVAFIGSLNAPKKGEDDKPK